MLAKNEGKLLVDYEYRYLLKSSGNTLVGRELKPIIILEMMLELHKHGWFRGTLVANKCIQSE